MNINKGALRLWVVVSGLWVGLVGWSWADTLKYSYADGCWTAPSAWRLPHNTDFGNFDNWEKHGDCLMAGLYPVDFLPALATRAATLPAGLLAVWFMGIWVTRGFRAKVTRT